MLQRGTIYSFPTPYPDELFYSLAARYGNAFRYPSHKKLLKSLFGSESVIACIEFPSHLAWFQQHLTPFHPCAEPSLIDQTTLLPWFTPFMPAATAGQLRDSMLTGNSQSAWVLSGLATAKVPTPEYLRYCPSCMMAHWSKGKEPYWQRLHQIPGIEVCPEHKVLLLDSEMLRRHRTTRHRYQIPINRLAYSRPTHCTGEVLIRVAQMGRGLLMGNHPSIGHDLLARNHRTILAKRGYLTAGGNVRIQKLRDLLRETYPAEYLLRIGCPLDGSRWLETFYRKRDRTHAPIRHLLLLCALGAAWEELFTAQPAEIAPTEDEQESYPPGWSTKLRRLWTDPKHSLRQIARSLGVDAKTVKRHAWKAGLPFPRKAPRKTTVRGLDDLRKKPDPTKETAKLQSSWLKVMAKHPKLHARELRAKYPGLYMKLYRRDKSWLSCHLPERKSVKPVSKVDWASRDDDLCGKLPQAVAQLLEEQPDGMVTIPAIARLLKTCNLLTRKLDRLPKCRAILGNLLESREDYACRRILRVAEECRESGTYISDTTLKKRAGITWEDAKSPRLRAALEQARSIIPTRLPRFRLYEMAA